jgi:hypothetical protein
MYFDFYQNNYFNIIIIIEEMCAICNSPESGKTFTDTYYFIKNILWSKVQT